MLLSRFLKFHRELVKSSKFTIRFLARLTVGDMRTTAGRTIRYLEDQCNAKKGSWETLTTNMIKSKLVYASPHVDDEWKPSLASDLLNIRQGNNDLSGFSREEIEELLHYICIN